MKDRRIERGLPPQQVVRMPGNCFLCDETATVACQDCYHTDGMNLFCSSCDELFHKRRDRAEHARGNIPSADEEAASTEFNR